VARREIDMGKHNTLDIHTKKEPRPMRNQGVLPPLKGETLNNLLND
jgi:hypothetical protein